MNNHKLKSAFVGMTPGASTRAVAAAALLAWVTLTAAAATPRAKQMPVDFNREIRPILSDHCFPCHGPDEKQRKAGLRLDLKEAVFATKDGVTLVVPGRSEASALIQRVTHSDP